MVIVVLNGLQAAVALAGLLLEPGAGDTADRVQPDHAAYLQYVQAYQAYALQYQQPGPPPAADAGARAHGAASARARRTDAAPESYQALQDSYTQYAGDPAPQPHRGPAAASAGAGTDPGIPSYGHSDMPSRRTDVRQQSPGEASSS